MNTTHFHDELCETEVATFGNLLLTTLGDGSYITWSVAVADTAHNARCTKTAVLAYNRASNYAFHMSELRALRDLLERFVPIGNKHSPIPLDAVQLAVDTVCAARHEEICAALKARYALLVD